MGIGSDDARSWARKLHFGDVRAKSVLMAICNYVDEDGCAYPGIPTLAEDTDQSDDSVRRRLKDLEEFKVLVRFPRFIDGNGKINTEARGRRTSDELRLRLATTQADVDAAKELRGTSEVDPRHGQGAGERGSGEDLTLASSEGSPSTAATGVNTEPLKEDNPPTPLKGGFDPTLRDETGWPEFEATFTSDGAPIVRMSIAKQVWSALTAAERSQVTVAASGYLASRRAERKPAAKVSAQTFLRERDAWDRLAAVVSPTGLGDRVEIKRFSHGMWVLIWRFDEQGVSPIEVLNRIGGGAWRIDARLAPTEAERARLVRIAVGSEEFEAWKLHAISRWPALKFRYPNPDVAEFAWVPAQWPPGYAPIDRDTQQEYAAT